MKTFKVVINDGKRSYGLSELAYNFLGLNWEQDVIWPLERKLPGISKSILLAGMAYKYDRTNPNLIKCIEALGIEAGIKGTHFIVVELPEGTEYKIVPQPMGGEDLVINKLGKG